ncbi:MAG TPA: response regulator, partial [Burkholderiales bacterium]
MSRTARAVICRELNQPVVVEEIRVAPPRRGEVTVRLGACGVCHSDLSATNGTLQMQLPLILGHEAAGEVVEVGEGVRSLAKGDHVVSSFIYMCGECRFCAAGRPVLCIEQGKAVTTLPDGSVRTADANGNPLNIFSGCGVMAEYATVHVDNLVKIDPEIPFDRAALVGCAVTTGVGAVFNTARVVPGSSVAVFGCGGVGLNVVQGARIAGAGRIIAIDTLEEKASLARGFGATDTLVTKPGEDPTKALKKMTGGGLQGDPARRAGGGGGRGEAGRHDRGAHHDAAVRGKDAHRQLFRLVRAAHRFPAHARAVCARQAEAGRAHHAPVPDRRGAAGVRGSPVRQERARRDPAPVSGRILVVDDQRANVEVLAGVLTARGYEVLTATDGEAALEQVRQGNPDLVVSDILMPQMDGYELCRRLRSEPATTLLPVILVTSLDPLQERVNGIDAGADDFLSKPVNWDELFARVRSLLRIKRLQDEVKSWNA